MKSLVKMMSLMNKLQKQNVKGFEIKETENEINYIGTLTERIRDLEYEFKFVFQIKEVEGQETELNYWTDSHGLIEETEDSDRMYSLFSALLNPEYYGM